MTQRLSIDDIRKINDESDQLLYELARHDQDQIAPVILLQALRLYSKQQGVTQTQTQTQSEPQLRLPAPVTAEPTATTTTTNTAISTIDLQFEQEPQ